jgi:hypothetical protein
LNTKQDKAFKRTANNADTPYYKATTPTIANTNLNAPNKTPTIVGSNLQANANNAVNTANTHIFTIKG